jgi:hypothetical protein
MGFGGRRRRKQPYVRACSPRRARAVRRVHLPRKDEASSRRCTRRSSRRRRPYIMRVGVQQQQQQTQFLELQQEANQHPQPHQHEQKQQQEHQLQRMAPVPNCGKGGFVFGHVVALVARRALPVVSSSTFEPSAAATKRRDGTGGSRRSGSFWLPCGRSNSTKQRPVRAIRSNR